MIVWFAGVPGGGRPGDCKREREICEIANNRLHSYYHLIDSKGKLVKNKIDLFLDSGAFSAFTQNIDIDIDEYIAFIKEHEKNLTVYANLDVIGSPEGTWKHQLIMEKAGLKPLPCFHYGEDIKWLNRYIARGHDYIALGGMAADKSGMALTTAKRAAWLDNLFSNYLCDKNGISTIKVHGFGMTSLRLMLRYPWYSVDSTSWVMTGRMGGIYIPRFRNGGWIYDEDSWKVCVSSKSPSKDEKGKHIQTMTPLEKSILLDYCASKGYTLGKSEFKQESEKYELQDGEKWSGKAIGGKRGVEVVVESGLCNDYRKRDELNIIYFLDLEKSMPAWPWAFGLKKSAGFGL